MDFQRCTLSLTTDFTLKIIEIHNYEVLRQAKVLTMTTEAPRIIKIMVVVIICIKTSELAFPLPQSVQQIRLN